MRFSVVATAGFVLGTAYANEKSDLTLPNATETRGMRAGVSSLLMPHIRMESCTTPEGSGTCMSTSACSATGGHSVSGYCSGGTDNQCCVAGEVSGELGVDISDPISASTASCYTSTYSFIIPRGYHSTGTVDTSVCDTIKTAYSAGFKVRDAYMFPCPTCSKSAAEQVQEVTAYLNDHCKAEYSGRLWLDVEGSQYWKGSSSANRAYYEELVDACREKSARCGVYTSSVQWEDLFGSSSYSYGSDLPLWYAHYDGSASFADFRAFAGWSTPHAKQYAGDVTVCSTDSDKNYSPSF